MGTFPSAYGYAFEAGKAVDGIYLPDEPPEYASVAATTKLSNPWWRVDLGQVRCIWAVNVLNSAG